jgi:hypothetical protein
VLKRLILVLLLSVCFRADGQTKRLPVVFVCQCSDGTGAIFATAFRDLLAASPRYIEASDPSQVSTDGKQNILNWEIRVISLDPSVNNTGESSAMSIVILLGDGIYGTHLVQWCKRENAGGCARDVLAEFDGYLNRQP